MFNRLRRWLHVDDPNILPVKVRLFIVIHWFILSFGILWAKPGWVRGLAYTGILSGTLGASVLFWETRLQADDVKRVTLSILRAGHQSNLTKSEWRGLVGMAVFGLLMTGVTCLAAWGTYERTHNGYQFIVQIELILLTLFVIPVAFLYVLTKTVRKWFYRSANRLINENEQGKVQFVKRYLQFLAFVFLMIAGFSQIPVTLLPGWDARSSPQSTSPPSP